jgi:hypothetical protein
MDETFESMVRPKFFREYRMATYQHLETFPPEQYRPFLCRFPPRRLARTDDNGRSPLNVDLATSRTSTCCWWRYVASVVDSVKKAGLQTIKGAMER